MFVCGLYFSNGLPTVFGYITNNNEGGATTRPCERSPVHVVCRCPPLTTARRTVCDYSPQPLIYVARSQPVAIVCRLRPLSVLIFYRPQSSDRHIRSFTACVPFISTATESFIRHPNRPAASLRPLSPSPSPRRSNRSSLGST